MLTLKVFASHVKQNGATWQILFPFFFLRTIDKGIGWEKRLGLGQVNDFAAQFYINKIRE